ncbi:hypothetical protein BN946_scf184945.g8 [Trametes cinnabarina]|uniref:Ketoreductase (KR) domain-containing protein n=1 Tax=Pycnoporus cinnabarinus TaxID=5643 RepID=A0A060SL90_PYCCI|nr:hypothetical protein BN946_scf184945.g8 [Trametes cinnabarina]
MSAQDIQPGPEFSNGLVGVARALHDTSGTPSPTIFSKEFSLADRVALVTGGNSGIGLESALAFVEAGVRAVYCLDISLNPSAEWTKVKEFASRLQCKAGAGRLEYISVDVSNQGIWKVAQDIGDKEGRLDICLAGAGIIGPSEDSLTLKASDYRKLMEVNLDGVLYTAQAAGQQMQRFNGGGSIILLASVLGHQSMPGSSPHLAYEVAKGGVLQIARSFACELATKGIRVNSISPGFVRTNMVAPLLATLPEERRLASLSPTGRIGSE